MRGGGWAPACDEHERLHPTTLGYDLAVRPIEIEDFLGLRPMPQPRLTLASGDQLIVTRDGEPFCFGLALILRGERERQRITSASRVISVPNIVLLEPLSPRMPQGRRSR